LLPCCIGTWNPSNNDTPVQIMSVQHYQQGKRTAKYTFYPLAGFTVMAYGSPAMSVIKRVQFGPLSWPTFMEYRNLVQWAV